MCMFIATFSFNLFTLAMENGDGLKSLIIIKIVQSNKSTKQEDEHFEFSRPTLLLQIEDLLYIACLSVCGSVVLWIFSSNYSIQIGCDKSRDIRIIETLICLQSSHWMNLRSKVKYFNKFNHISKCFDPRTLKVRLAKLYLLLINSTIKNN